MQSVCPHLLPVDMLNSTFNQRMAPDLRKKVDAARAARLAREQATQRQADAQQVCPRFQIAKTSADVPQLNDPDAQKPIWAESPRS